jgi:replicative DNA helicase
MTKDPLKYEPLVGATLNRIGVKIQTSVPSIATPFPSWNKQCGEEGGREGIAHTWMVVIGGADGSGKSYLAVNLAANAVMQGEKVGFINFEMTESGLAQRYLAILAGVPKYRLENGKWFSARAWAHATGIADQIFEETGGSLITNSTSVYDLGDIEASYKRLADEGCTMICLDYAQLVKTGSAGIFQRSEEVSNTVRALGHEYSVVTAILSQLNREGKKIAETPPTRHHLQGGTWENDANQIILIDHTVQIHDKATDSKHTRIILDKNRHGAMPVAIPVSWDLRTMRWNEGGLPEASEDVTVAPVEEAEPNILKDGVQGFMEV